MSELNEPEQLLKTFIAAIVNHSTHDTVKIYRELYQLGEPIIPAIETQLLGYTWENIDNKVQVEILSTLLSLVNDINEESARELGKKIQNKGCNAVVKVKIKSILAFSLNDFRNYQIQEVEIYQLKSLDHDSRIKNKMISWLSSVSNEDLKKIERLYIIPADAKYSGTYMPMLCKIMIVWDCSYSEYNPLSYFRLLRIEHTLYHEIGHHVHRHTFGQHPEQEKEADRYAKILMRKNHPILYRIAKTVKCIFGYRKSYQKINNLIISSHNGL